MTDQPKGTPMNTLAPSPPLGLSNLRLDAPIPIDDGLDIVFLRHDSILAELPISFLPEVPDGLLIEEKGGGSVPVLVARNQTSRPILVLAGQLIRGGKQNRGTNADALVPANGTIDIPVTCVEQGRWSGRALDRFRGEGIEPAFIRGEKMRHVHRSRRTSNAEPERPGIGREHLADQGEVWQRIAEFRDRCEVGEASSDLLDALRDSAHRDRRPVDLTKARESGRDACGALIFIGGEFVGGDLLATSGWFARVADDLLGSAVSSHRYARALAGRPLAGSDLDSVAHAAEAIVDGLRRGAWRKHRPIGAEQAWQLDHPFLEASATLAPEGEALHLLVGTRHRPSVFTGSREAN
jgi:hypothetical protein